MPPPPQAFAGGSRQSRARPSPSPAPTPFSVESRARRSFQAIQAVCTQTFLEEEGLGMTGERKGRRKRGRGWGPGCGWWVRKASPAKSGDPTYLQQQQERREAAARRAHGGPGGGRVWSGRAGPGSSLAELPRIHRCFRVPDATELGSAAGAR